MPYCPKCGEAVHAGDAFCMECGEAVDTDQVLDPLDNASTQRGRVEPSWRSRGPRVARFRES